MEFFFEIIRLGLKNLRLQLVRSFLTALGIILGVGDQTAKCLCRRARW